MLACGLPLSRCSIGCRPHVAIPQARPESHYRTRVGADHHLDAVRRFRYLLDPLFLVCCALYALNRWEIRPHTHIVFFRSWFNDTLLIPCALPPVLFLHRLARLRSDDRFPTGPEIFAHWLGWSILFEFICPRFMPHTTGDPWDVVAYGAGALVAWGWWRRAGRAIPAAVSAS